MIVFPKCLMKIETDKKCEHILFRDGVYYFDKDKSKDYLEAFDPRSFKALCNAETTHFWFQQRKK